MRLTFSPSLRIKRVEILIHDMFEHKNYHEIKSHVFAHNHRQSSIGLASILHKCMSCDVHGVVGNAREICYHLHEMDVIVSKNDLVMETVQDKLWLHMIYR